MINWSSNYYEGLDEFQHQTNDMWFYRMRQLLNDDEYTIDRQYPMQYDIPSLDEVEYSYLDSLLTAGTSK